MKILILLPSSSLGGAERVATLFAQECLSRGHTINIISLSNQGTEGSHLFQLELMGANIYHYNFKSEFLGVMLFVIDLFASRIASYDLIYSTHVHTNSLVGALRAFQLLKSRRHVCRESTDIFVRFNGFRLFFYQALYYIGYRNQDLLICQTMAMERQLPLWLKNRIIGRVVVANNPVSFPCIISGPNRSPIILCVGRLIPIKNTLSLLKALVLLRRTGELGGYRLIIAGDGPMKDILNDFILVNDLKDCARLLGAVDDCTYLYKAASIGILPSIREGFPNVILEMMAHGVPQIISTLCTPSIGDIPHIQICNDDDVSLSNSLSRALQSDLDYSFAFREYVKKNHSPRSFVDLVLEC